MGSFRQAFLAALKAVFPRERPTDRALLLDGCVVVALEGKEQRAAESAWDAICQGVLEEEGNKRQLEDGIVWCHVGLHYLRPYRPTPQVLEEVETLPNGRVVLTQTGGTMISTT